MRQSIRRQVKFVVQSAALSMGLGLWTAAAQAQTFEVDFSQRTSPPLSKTKFGIYQTPLTTLPRLLQSIPVLPEIGVRDFRYEMGWGKPDALASNQIGGTAQNLTYDFSSVDALLNALKAVDVKPLLSMTYCPDPLKSRTGWESWKDRPSDLAAWERINRDYAAHLASRGAPQPYYEIWNEPDMPDPDGKMFFNGGPQEYEQLYRHAAAGIREGAPGALVGGPAAAWNLSYLTPILSQPLDFVSMHAYGNYASQIGAMRAALAARPQLPIFLTEYGSYADWPANGPQSRHAGAMRFFSDVKGLLPYNDVTKVYWAQWLDAGNSPGMGLITWDGHRKAIFNAFKIYNLMPVDRNAVSPESLQDVHVMASSDPQNAAVVLWNESSSQRSVKIDLRHLPFASGTMQLFRIDAENASYVDNPASETLRPLQTTALGRDGVSLWQGNIPAQGVVFLIVSNKARKAPVKYKPLGTYVGSQHQFGDRKSTAYADFDEKTGTARLGMGEGDGALAQIGSLIENPAPRWRVQVEKSGSHQTQMGNKMAGQLGIRLDFQAATGRYSHSVLLHDQPKESQTATLPWNAENIGVAQTIFQNALNTGRPFEINLARLAPTDWNHKRVIVTFLMQNTGRGSQAKFTLSGR